MLSEVVVLDSDGSKMVPNDGTFFSYKIHPDDTSKHAKLKMSRALQCPPEELYFFGIKPGTITVEEIYTRLSQDGTVPVTRSRLLAALNNVHPINIERLENRDEYDFEDLMTIGLPTTGGQVLFPIGQKYTGQDTYPVSANPFDVVELDPNLVSSVQKLATMHDAQVLLHYGTSRLHIITAQSVSAYERKVGFPSGSLLSIYFPKLLADGPINASVLTVKHTTALEAALIESAGLEQTWEAVDLSYAEGIQPVRLESGISEISFTHYATSSASIPVDVVFKVLNSRPDRPLLKYNAGARMEKLFRLYAPTVARNGNRCGPQSARKA